MLDNILVVNEEDSVGTQASKTEIVSHRTIILFIVYAKSLILISVLFALCVLFFISSSLKLNKVHAL